MKKERKDKEERGITLIALVITIIVLLILAGVTILALTGDEGILTKTEQAKGKNDLESLKEEASLMFSKRTIDDYTQTKNSLKEDIEKQISGEKQIEEIEGINDAYYVTRNGQTITVYEDGTIAEGRSIWDGKKSKPTIDSQKNWHIYTPQELKFFEEFVNGDLTTDEKAGLTIDENTKVYLENHIDLGARQEGGVQTRGTSWEPIGKDSEHEFIGTFEGKNHIIRGIYIDTTEQYIGVFGRAKNIKDLVIKEGYVSGGAGTGGVVGVLIASGSVENCRNEGVVVKGKGERTGGIIGTANNSSTITNCINKGEVTGEGKWTGGVVGMIGTNSSIERCTNEGMITGKGGRVGGVLGHDNNTSQIINCTNEGVIKGEDERIGGVVGDLGQSSAVNNCINKGKVIGDGLRIGGITGISFGTIEKCYNTGEISQTGGEGILGGICGVIGNEANAIIRNCYNIGKIIEEGNSKTKIGGILGWLGSPITSVTISNNYNIGKIEIKGENVTNVGGIVGKNDLSTASIQNNYYLEGIYHTAENKIGESKTSTFMKTQEFVDLLNTGLTEKIWEINGQNDGYPVIIGM